MKKFGFLALVLGFVWATPGFSASIVELPEGDPNAHTIELLSSNVFDGEFYVWTYRVTSGGGRDVKAISHFVMDICLDYFDHAEDEGGTMISTLVNNPDPTLNMLGLKFNDGYEDGESRIVTIYMTKELEIVESQVGIKSGQNLFYGFIDGPSCDCPEEEVPEPATMALIGAGILGMTARRRRASR